MTYHRKKKKVFEEKGNGDSEREKMVSPKNSQNEERGERTRTKISIKKDDGGAIITFPGGGRR